MDYEQFSTGNYLDRGGRKWFCVRRDKEGRMECERDDGAWTVASFSTFEVWGWTKDDKPN